MLGILGAAVVAVNPIRNVVTDDDFAYARMVEHLLTTGEFRLHDWATASMPVRSTGALLSAWLTVPRFVSTLVL